MCKLVIYTKAPFANNPARQRTLFDKLLRAMGATEPDGLGIAFLDADGRMHRRRWATFADFKGVKVDDYRGQKFCAMTSEPKLDAVASGFVLLHGRSATSEKGLRNAHPHVAEDHKGGKYALIHNGSVNSSDEHKRTLGPLLSGCDSELILAAWIRGGMEGVSEMITGRYAFSVIVQNPPHGNFLHVVKDGNTGLYCGPMDDHSYIFATTNDLAKMAGASDTSKVEDNIHLTFDSTGDLTGIYSIPPPQQWPTYSYTGYRPTTPYVPPASVPAVTPVVTKPPTQEKLPLEADDSDEELDAKIAKSRARLGRLWALKRQRQNFNRSVIAQSATPPSGVSSEHSVPISDDEAQALLATQREAGGAPASGI